MATINTPGALSQAIGRAIESHADALRDEFITDAVSKFEAELRAAVLKTAVRAQDLYRIETDGREIRITVQHKSEA